MLTRASHFIFGTSPTDAALFSRIAQQYEMTPEIVNTHFTGTTSPENRFLLNELGDIRGKELLDLGCGGGENSIYFSSRGAQCTGLDQNAEMLEAARKNSLRFGLEPKFINGSAEALPFPDESFDIIYAANLLHHVDLPRTIRECYRVLRPGGVLATWDPLRHNPMIKIYRLLTRSVHSRSESALSYRDIDHVRRTFDQVKTESFWFFTQLLFLKFFLWERVNPNQELYWKKIVFEEQRLRKSYLSLERLDSWIKHVPLLQRFAWNVAVVARKNSAR